MEHMYGISSLFELDGSFKGWENTIMGVYVGTYVMSARLTLYDKVPAPVLRTYYVTIMLNFV